VTNVVRIPTINAAISSEDRAAKSKSVSSIVMAELAQIQAAQANVQPAEPPAAPSGPMLATTQTDALAVERPSVVAPATSVRVAPDLKVAPEQPAVQPPPAAVLPELRPAVSLSSGEVAAMLKRGRDLLAAGDIASGRLMLTHVAEAGDAEASFLLAGTYDAAVLAKLRVVGVQPDPAKARAWYAKAAEQGSLEARQRLQALR
jgi:TPR repeat protein